MSPPRPPALAPPDGRGSGQQHSMVPQTPASTGRRWTIFGSQDFDRPADMPDAVAASTSNPQAYYSLNPSFGLTSQKVNASLIHPSNKHDAMVGHFHMLPNAHMPTMQASSPWPDVIISSHPDLATVHQSAVSQPPSDFHVELPYSSFQHVINDPVLHTSSGASVTAGNSKLTMPGTADMYGEQQQKSIAGRAIAQE